MLYTANHDSPRLAAAAGGDERLMQLYMLAMLTQNAVPKIYQGDEIGMPSDDTAPWKEWSMNRVCARTPIAWNDGPNAGFSSAPASKLYLPVSKGWQTRNMERQGAKAGSLLDRTRKMIQLRREHPALRAWGEKVTLHARPKDPVYAYARKGGGETMVVALNISGSRRRTALDLSRLGAKAGARLQDVCRPHGQRLEQRVLLRDQVAKTVVDLGPFGYQVFSVQSGR